MSKDKSFVEQVKKLKENGFIIKELKKKNNGGTKK